MVAGSKKKLTNGFEELICRKMSLSLLLRQLGHRYLALFLRALYTRALVAVLWDDWHPEWCRLLPHALLPRALLPHASRYCCRGWRFALHRLLRGLAVDLLLLVHVLHLRRRRLRLR